MPTDYGAIGRLLASSTRSEMIAALMEGRPLAAGELARMVGVPPSSASEHLKVLVDGDLVTVYEQGRRRFYAISKPEVAEALESLAQICPPKPVVSLRGSMTAQRLALARTCYDHLAGKYGVLLLERLIERAWLVSEEGGYAVSSVGDQCLTELGVDVAAARTKSRAFARPCLDWTERRHHLAGTLGASLTTVMLERGWFTHQDHGRGLTVTKKGCRALSQTLGIDAQ